MGHYKIWEEWEKEKMLEDNDLNASKGIIFGILISLCFWGLVGLLVFFAMC